MEEIIQQLAKTYQHQIAQLDRVSATEINVSLKNNVDATSFAQELKDHLVDLIDELTILKVNILDENGLLNTFSTNQ